MTTAALKVEVTTAPYPPIHVLVCGEPGSGKSSFAATFPKPILVCNFDALGKENAYKRKGAVTAPRDEAPGLTIEDITNDQGELLVTIENYYDADFTRPTAFQTFRARGFEGVGRIYRTVVFDSITSAALTCRKLYQYKINPQSKEPRQWYGAATDQLEEVLCGNLTALRGTNVVVIAHVSEEKDEVHGSFVRTFSAPGRLTTRRGLTAYYPELYYAFIKVDDGKQRYLLQTRKSSMYNAFSQVCEAPDPCEPRYSALWAEWPGQQVSTNGNEPTQKGEPVNE